LFKFNDGTEGSSEYLYGAESEGPPSDVVDFVRATVRETDAWYQQQLKLGSGGPYQESPSTHPDPLLKICSKTVPRPCADKLPKVTYQPDPEFSLEAKEKKIEGVVVVGLVVGTDGLPHDIHLVKSRGYGLDEMAIQSVQRWKFKPAQSEGKPVPVAISVEIDFRVWHPAGP